MGWGGFRASPLSFCQTALKNLCPVRCPLISGDNYVASGPLSGQSAFLPNSDTPLPFKRGRPV